MFIRPNTRLEPKPLDPASYTPTFRYLYELGGYKTLILMGSWIEWELGFWPSVHIKGKEKLEEG